MSQLDRHDRIMSAVRGSIMSGVIVSSVELRREWERDLRLILGSDPMVPDAEVERVLGHE